MLQFSERCGWQLVLGYALQKLGGFLLGEFLFLSNPLYEFPVLRTDPLASHTSYHAVVPGGSHPLGKRDIAFLFVMIRDAPFSTQKKTV
jgi:hypothetical protein